MRETGEGIAVYSCSLLLQMFTSKPGPGRIFIWRPIGDTVKLFARSIAAHHRLVLFLVLFADDLVASLDG